MTINTLKFQTGLTGNTQGTSMAAGLIGEMITGSGSNVATNTSTYTTVATATLTTGVWLVSGCIYSDNVATQTGADAALALKGTTGSTLGDDLLLARQGIAQTANLTFASRVLVVASGDSDKTIAVRAKSVTAAGACYGRVIGVRIA